jgi:hypothetical protein
MRFQSPQLGALGVAFNALRGLQFVSLVAVVGLTANFINGFASSQREVPDVLVGTVIVVCISPLLFADDHTAHTTVDEHLYALRGYLIHSLLRWNATSAHCRYARLGSSYRIDRCRSHNRQTALSATV